MADTSIDWPSLLRELRKSRGLKQEAAAELLGVSQATISRWERGVAAPTAGMRNRLFGVLRRDRSPLATLSWVQTFRRLFGPGAISSEARVMHAMTSALAAEIGVPRAELEGLQIGELFGGEVMEPVERAREAGAFAGAVACSEACAHFRIDPSIRRDCGFDCHYISWPHFTEDGEIVLVSQGRFVSEQEAAEVRARLGGSYRRVEAA